MPAAAYAIKPETYRIVEDRPVEKMPVRRLQNEGGDVLTVNELLQIALGKVDGLETLLNDYGIQFLARLQTVPEIVDTLKLDHLQATRLLAILSLGKRLYNQSQGSLVQVRGIEDIYHHYRSMSHLAKEQLRIALINSRYQLIHEETLAIGSIADLHVSPRDVFQPAVERRVAAVILVHNHPSGDSEPSESDITFTKEMVAAGNLLGIQLLDHVIIGSSGYSSCLANKDRKALKTTSVDKEN